MNIINRKGVLKAHGIQDPDMIILHDTVSPTVRSAENGLTARGLGYHYIIEKNGDVYQYASPKSMMWHAKDYNTGTIGISYVGGGPYGEVNDVAIAASIELINSLKEDCSKLTMITAHKYASVSGKIDPRFPGDPENGAKESVDDPYMTHIADATGLDFVKPNDDN